MKKFMTAAVALAFALVCAQGFAAAAEKAPAVKGSLPVAEKKADVKSAPVVKEELLDLNTATDEQLKKIPGIGDEYAKKIIAGRPYVKKDQLVSRKILPVAVYEKVKSRIIAKQPKQENAKQGK